MKYIGITEARQNLRAVIARVEHGERIKITRQSKAVAQLGSPRKCRKILPSLAEYQRELGRTGSSAAELLRAGRSAK